MYAVSTAFRTALQNEARTDKITGTINLTNGVVINFSDDDIKSGSVKIDNQCVNGEALEFGAVYAGQLSFTLQTDVNRYALYDGVVTLQYALQLDTGAFEAVPLGVYTITDATRNGENVAITALDNMVKMQTDYDGVATLGKPFDILTHLCVACGMELANTRAEIEALPNGKETFQIDSTCNISTWVDAVAMIAQMLASFGTATRDGKLSLRQFHTAQDGEIIADQRFDTNVSDYISSYMGLVVTDSNGVTIESYDKETTNGLIMEISGNALFDVGLEEHKQTLVDNIRKALCVISYTPTDVSCVADPTIECGDGITYAVGDNTAFTVVTSYAWQYRGKETIKAVGKNPYLTNVKNRADKATAALRKQLGGSKIVFNSFVNSEEYTVKQEEKRILEMAATSVSKSSAVFIAQILLTVTPATLSIEKSGNDSSGNTLVFSYSKDKPCELTFAYYLNGVEIEEYHPIDHYDAGEHIIALYYPLPDMEENTTNRFRVTVKADTGTAFIGISQIRATVIGNGLAAEGAWDGTITITDSISCPPVVTNGAVGVNGLADSITTSIDTPKRTAITETISAAQVAENGTVSVNGLTENIYFASVVKSWTLLNASVSYNGAYIVGDATGYTMRTEWQYNSTEETIDSGLMCVVQTKTDDLETVESVVIE